jgi:hypothetical protein
MPRREHPRYEHMEWPEWEFREFPMMLYPRPLADGEKSDVIRKPVYHTEGRLKGKLKFPGVIVNDDDELAAVLAGDADINAEEGRLVNESDVRTALIRECELHNVEIDRRWGTEKIQAALDKKFKEEEDAEEGVEPEVVA